MATFIFCDVAKAKQNKREALIPDAWRATAEQIERCRASAQAAGRSKEWPMLLPKICLNDRDFTITQSDGPSLLQKMWQECTITAREVCEAFCKRACLAHQTTNCLTEICFEEAMQRADELDREFAQTKQQPGVLAGLPISIKDNFNIKGLDTTLGFVAWANDPAQSESLLIQILREQGAIIFCKTNVPTAMMIPETLNNTWGRTLNPLNLECTPGGSSGGEGALVKMRGSVVGVGTDIGGSIRIPGSLCALFSLKPSLGRFPTFGARSAMPGQEAVHSINGPLANDLASLRLFAQAIVDWKPWRFDIKCVPIPWNYSLTVPKTGLTFGILFDDGCVHPEPPITRALQTVKEKLERAGHTVIEWKVKDDIFAKLTQVMSSMFGADGGAKILELMKQGGEDGRWVPGLAKPGKAMSMTDLWALQSERGKLAGQITQQWDSMRGGPENRVMDVLLAPAGPFAAVRHDQFIRHVMYTGVWNLLDFAAATMPVSTGDATLDAKMKHTPSSFYNAQDEEIWKQYDEQLSDAMPISVQVVGRRLEEEKLLAIVERIVESL